MIFRSLLLLMLIIASQTTLATISVSVDRSPVVADESFQLVFESDRKIKGQPDFTPLNKDFNVLNSNQRSHTKIINGDITHSQEWVLTVLANKTGNLTIPPIKFGQESSKALSLNVVKSSPSTKSNKTDDVYIEVITSTTEPYVQAQLIFTIKLYRAIATNNASLSEPSIKGGQAIIDRLGEDKSYEKRSNGKRYVVIERNYVLFPQASGKLTIEPIVFQGQTGRNSFFNFDPFGPQGKTIVKRSDAIVLNVKPIPDSFTGQTWLPAQNLRIQEQWSMDPEKLSVGEAATRTLTLSAMGLAASHLPAIDNGVPDSLKQYPDQPEFEESIEINGLNGVRHEKMAIIPTEAGLFQLDAITVPWWNTETDQQEYAELPERTIKVIGTVVAQSNEPVIQSESQTETLDISNGTNNEIDLIEIDRDIVEPSYWKMISFLLFFVWIITLFLWWMKTRKKQVVNNNKEKELSSSHYLRKLKTSCKNNDPIMTRDILIKWAQVNWKDSAINSVGDIKLLCSREFSLELEKLNSYLYSVNVDTWNGNELYRHLENYKIEVPDSYKKSEKLEPLYKT